LEDVNRKAELRAIRRWKAAGPTGQSGCRSPKAENQSDPRCDGSSSPGEFHPQALTEPDVTVSRHPALIIPSQLSETCFTAWLLPSLVDQKVKPDDPTPSLHPHYRDFNATMSWSVPVPCIGTLTLMGSSHLSVSLNIRTTGSHVPQRSLIQSHATSTPEAT